MARARCEAVRRAATPLAHRDQFTRSLAQDQSAGRTRGHADRALFLLRSRNMKNTAQWKPTKYRVRGGRLGTSWNPKEVAPASRLVTERVARVYEEALQAYAHGDLLDVGCGRVPLFGTYRDRVVSVTTVDWPNSVHDLEHIDRFMNLAEPWELDDASFDTVLATDVMEHVPEPRQFVHEMARVLRPDGVTIVGTPFMYWLHEVPNEYQRLTEHQLRRLGRLHGLETVELRSYGGAPEILFDLTMRAVRRPRWIARALCEALPRIAMLPGFERLANGTRDMTPLGYLWVARKKPSA